MAGIFSVFIQLALVILGKFFITSEARGLCACGYNVDLVCASNGLTYPNSCLLNCDRYSDPHLRMVRQGKCGDQPSAYASASQGACACSRNNNPVCASNGNTYENDCYLNCERRRDPSLRMVSRGECEVQHEYDQPQGYVRPPVYIIRGY